MGQEIIKNAVDDYVNFTFEGRRLRLPYVLDQSRWRFWRTCGKGSPSEVKGEMEKVIRRGNIDLSRMSDAQVTRWLRDNKIGIECSGFAYNVLEPLVREKTGKPLSKHLIRFPGVLGRLDRQLIRYQRRRRISADTLTNDLNTVAVASLKDIRPGDLIRLTPSSWQGKHVAVVVEVTQDKIVYAHSSRETVVQGPHLGEIEIIDFSLGIGEQSWQEVTKNGKNYGKLSLKVENGDGARRLKCLL